MPVLPQSFYDRDTIQVARELLGKHIVRKVGSQKMIGKIVEVEAYLGPHDLAAHSARGRTPRTEVMFGPPGHAYVYMIYGMYFCLNFVTQKEGHASAVLIRALEPVKNITASTKGPGLLCKALQINKMLNAHDLTKTPLSVHSPLKEENFKIAMAPRIGVDYAGDWAKELLRFYIDGNPFVSRKPKLLSSSRK